MSGFLIPELTRERQDRASQPRASAWVSANAGSGKTFVLSRRVVRLLLDGTDPSRILALTFTKAAAAEMATRVFKILGEWVTKDDKDLANELEEIEGRTPDAKRVAFARRLFAEALETPGGLKIQTIHGFCEALLHQFPLEANVAGHFQVLDDRIGAELMAEARGGVLHLAETNPNSELGNALNTVIGLMADGTAEKALDELIQNRDDLRRWVEDKGGLTNAISELAAELGIPETSDLPALEARFLSDCPFDPNTCLSYAEAFRTGSGNDLKMADALAGAAVITDPKKFKKHWLPLFLTQKMEPRKKLANKCVAEAYPAVIDALVAEQQRLLDLLEERKLIVTFVGTRALLALAHAVIERYENAKMAKGFLDFEDLVVKTARLLARSDAALWVQYKLDQGLDHILVDEAQDTSPRQWQVVSSLAAEFFSGEGASDRVRTLFAVGDEKQSIYSFQGAVPAYFDTMRRQFSKHAEAAQHTFHSVDLQLSFRSTPDVLGAVDKVFKESDAYQGLSQELKAPVHEAIRRDPGLVEIWPLEQEADVLEPEDWREPIDHVGISSPPARVAQRISTAILDWMEKGEVAPGDIMVLVRKRGAFVEILNRELKQRGIPVAGSDRLVLTDHIAVQDLAALGRFLLLSEDDLSLAAVLKSPLFQLTDEDLLEIARDPDGRRRAGTLWQGLVSRAKDMPKWEKVRSRLDIWRARADFMPPFEFYSRLLSADGGRRQFRKRLGVEVDDVLDEFLNLTLAYEQSGTPGLEGFLAWMAAAPTEIKRELTSTKGLVRVMTVHGSKGLEAKVVILVDPGSKPVNATHDPAFLPRESGVAGAPPALVWLPTKADRTQWHNSAIEARHETQAEEYRRLLYVALTRAEDRLVVCGWEPKSGAPENGWYNLVSRALKADAREIKNTAGETTAWQWQRAANDPEVMDPQETHHSDVRTETALMLDLPPPPPQWLAEPVKALPRKRRLQPSKVFEVMEEKERIDPVPTSARLKSRLADPSWPLERGRIVHRLLEFLPEMPAEDRDGAIDRFLDASLPVAFKARKSELSDEIQKILLSEEFAPLFAETARAEVPVAGTILTTGGAEIAVSGQIDRLVECPDHVLIVDYKTNVSVPRHPEEVSAEYRAQLSVYSELLKGVFSGKAIKAALLWTSQPVLMLMPDDLLEETFKALKPDGTAS